MTPDQLIARAVELLRKPGEVQPEGTLWCSKTHHGPEPHGHYGRNGHYAGQVDSTIVKHQGAPGVYAKPVLVVSPFQSAVADLLELVERPGTNKAEWSAAVAVARTIVPQEDQ